MSIPLPGTPVRGSKTGKPIMALLDLLGRTWALGIVWNLNKGGCTFRELQTRCEDISPTVLNARLKELVATGFVIKTRLGYELTELGSELFVHIEPLGLWSYQWRDKLNKEAN